MTDQLNDKLTIGETAAVIYLVAPMLTFCAGFLRVEIAILACAVSLYLLYEIIRLTARPKKLFESSTVVVLLLTAVWVGLSSGIGTLQQNSDWYKHYQILGVLVERPWPAIEYLPSYGDSVVRYYLGWYLIPALILKLSPSVTIYVTAVWSAIGIFLFFNLVRSIVPGIRGAVIVPLVFVLFGGADYLGTTITGVAIPSIEHHYEWWAGWIQYSANTTSLFWVPQHAIAAWLGVALLWRFRERLGLLPYLGFLMSALLLWSPFSAIGLIPFLIVLLLNHGLRAMTNIRSIASIVVLALPIGLYLTSDVSAIPNGYIFLLPCIGESLPCFSWFGYLRFLALEVGLALIILLLRREFESGFLIAAAIALCLVPLYKMGIANDFAMRVSLPALAVVALLCGKTLARWPKYSAPILVIMLLMALPTALREGTRGLASSEQAMFPRAAIPPEQYIDQPLLIGQYFARMPVWVIRPNPNSVE